MAHHINTIVTFNSNKSKIVKQLLSLINRGMTKLGLAPQLLSKEVFKVHAPEDYSTDTKGLTEPQYDM